MNVSFWSLSNNVRKWYIYVKERKIETKIFVRLHAFASYRAIPPTITSLPRHCYHYRNRKSYRLRQHSTPTPASTIPFLSLLIILCKSTSSNWFIHFSLVPLLLLFSTGRNHWGAIPGPERSSWCWGCPQGEARGGECCPRRGDRRSRGRPRRKYNL